MISSKVIDYIHKSSKKFVNEHYKEEAIFFDNIWEIYEPELRKRINKHPEKWRFKILRHKLMGALGFTDVSQALNIMTPIIVTTLSATIVNIKDLGYIPNNKEIRKILDKNAKAFGAKGILISQMIRYLQDLYEVLPKILEEEKEIIRCKINRRGDIDYLDYEDKEKWDKNEFLIWIDNTKKKSSIYVREEGKIELSNKAKETFIFLIKKAGRTCRFWEFYVNVLGIPKEDIPKYKEESLRDRIFQAIKEIRKSEILRKKKLIKTERNTGYRAEEELKNFCIIDFEKTVN